MRRVVIMGAGGRDFHDFNVVFRTDPEVRVVAFTAAQIPGLAGRVYPPSLAGELYPDGIPIEPEEELAEIVRAERVDEVVFAYSDVSHEEVIHRASLALAAGADFRLLGPAATMLRSAKPVVAVCAVRTGSGKSQTSRAVGRLLTEHGLSVALVRHPMPYGDLERMRVQRFASLADVDAAEPTVEEREEYEASVAAGMVVYAGVDYAGVLHAAEAEADVIVWDGGNNDFPFFAPDLALVVADALRPDHGLRFHPGETNLRLADVVVVNKVDRAAPGDVEAAIAAARSVRPDAVVVLAASPVTLADGPPLAGLRVLAVEDGPTVTHGGLPFGAGAVAADAAGAELVDPRPYAVGSLAETFAAYPGIGPVLPAMGYSTAQMRDLEATIEATPCDAVVAGTPVDLGRLLSVSRPIRRAAYEYRDAGSPTLADALAPFVERVRSRRVPPWR
jgi:predicted GTPase